MTVCTHKITLGDLSEDATSTSRSLDQVAHVGDLDLTRTVVPRHCGWVVGTTAVGTWAITLKVAIPLDQPTAVPALLLDPNVTRPPVVRSVVLTPTDFAPRLSALAAAVEVGSVSYRRATAASFRRHVASIDISTDVTATAR
jgi:hypothetical protein